MTKLLAWTLRVLGALALLIALGLAGSYWQAGRRESANAKDLAPRTGRYVPALDVEMFVQETGPPTGPAVVFVHGTGAWSETWRDTLTALADQGFHAIALDLPPFGFSTRPASGRYDKLTQGKRIQAALQSLQLDRVILVGHSFGGGPTAEAALLQPAEVQALALVDVALSLESGTPAPASPLLQAVLGAAPLRNALVATFLTNPFFTQRLLRSFVADPAVASEPRVRIYQQPLAVHGTTEATGQWLPELLTPAAGAASSKPASYQALTMPALVLWGKLDTITPLEQGRAIASALPHARLAVMENVGHIPQIEDNAAFNQKLLEFLKEVTNAARASSGTKPPSGDTAAR